MTCKHYRSSLDCFYFGLRIDKLEVSEHLKEIKKNLFHVCNIPLFDSNKGNGFYNFSLVNDVAGVQVYYGVRKDCKNDEITVNLQGTFFRNYYSIRLVNKWLENFKDKIIYQRVDVCLDCIFLKSDKQEYCLNTNTINFPYPVYRDSYRGRPVPFIKYVRVDGAVEWSNMICQGKGNYRFKVYDKQLDIQEKDGKNVSYCDIYSLDIPFDEITQIYRIEAVYRGDAVKGLIDKYCKKYGDIKNVADLVSMGYNYIFNRYEFQNVDNEKFRKMSDCNYVLTLGYREKLNNLFYRKKYHIDIASSAIKEVIRDDEEIANIRKYGDELEKIKLEEDYRVYKQKGKKTMLDAQQMERVIDLNEAFQEFLAEEGYIVL